MFDFQDVSWKCSFFQDASWKCSIFLDASWKCSIFRETSWKCSIFLDASWKCSIFQEASWKCSIFQNVFWIFWRLLHDRPWDRPLTDFGSNFDSQTGPKSILERFWNVSNFIIAFECHPGPPRIDLWTNMAPAWPSNRPQVGLKKCQNQSKNGSGEPKWPSDPSKIEFWLIFARLW